jgi:CO/xanthine dehydrogenase FAD-binding subunit
MNSPLAEVIHEPRTIEEALSVLSEKGKEAAIIAGGTDLVIKLKERVIRPQSLVDIMKLPLSYIKGSRAKGLQIGATTSAKDIGGSALLKKELPILVDAAVHLGGPQTQAMATVGGNICNASPCANFTNVLAALDAVLTIRGMKKGKEASREIPVKDICRGPGIVGLEPGELVSEITVPPLPEAYGACYVKHTLRKEMDIAIVGVAVFVIADGETVKKVRIALGSVGATVVLAERAQQVMEGKVFSPHLVETAGRLAAEKDASYIDDVRSSAAYRRTITEVAVKKAAFDAWSMAKGGRR